MYSATVANVALHVLHTGVPPSPACAGPFLCIDRALQHVKLRPQFAKGHLTLAPWPAFFVWTTIMPEQVAMKLQLGSGQLMWGFS